MAIVVASIVGVDRFSGGYGAAKLAHERASLAGPVPASIVRITQFHELVEQMMEWGAGRDVIQIRGCATQPWRRRPSARCSRRSRPASAGVELGGPREACAGRLVAAKAATGCGSRPSTTSRLRGRRDAARNGALLAGPTFEEWLTSR